MGFHEASGDTIALTVETGKYQQQIGDFLKQTLKNAFFHSLRLSNKNT